MSAQFYYPAEKAVAIEFSRDSNGKVFVDGKDWPLFARINAALLNSAGFEAGSNPVVFSSIDGNGIITVTCHTGIARYRAGQITSANEYICELMSSTRSKFS